MGIIKKKENIYEKTKEVKVTIYKDQLITQIAFLKSQLVDVELQLKELINTDKLK